MSPQKKKTDEKIEPEVQANPEVQAKPDGKVEPNVQKESDESGKKVVQPVKFADIDAGVDLGTQMKNIKGLLDVPMKISVRLGGTILSIQELLNVGPGSVLTLDNVAGGSVEVLVNNKIFARGEIVVVDDNFGVRIISLVSSEELVRKMGGE